MKNLVCRAENSTEHFLTAIFLEAHGRLLAIAEFFQAMTVSPLESDRIDSSRIESTRFSFRAAKELVRDLHRPNPMIYWVDFLSSIIIGHLLFTTNVRSDLWLPQATHAIGLIHDSTSNTVAELAFKGLILAATTLLFLRAAMFTHELVHLPRDGWNGFRFAWNLLCGIPFLIPSFTYYPHIDHHRRKSYGTDEDGEYLNLSHRPPSAIVLYMLGVLITPLAGLIRFGLMSPICWVYPAARKWTFRHASTMVMDITYQRPEASSRVYRIMLIQEAACFGVCLYL
ncbi:MAG: fatty acid desaturase, partial [Pirellula sp.]